MDVFFRKNHHGFVDVRELRSLTGILVHKIWPRYGKRAVKDLGRTGQHGTVTVARFQYSNTALVSSTGCTNRYIFWCPGVSGAGRSDICCQNTDSGLLRSSPGYGLSRLWLLFMMRLYLFNTSVVYASQTSMNCT